MRLVLHCMPPLINASYKSGSGRFYKDSKAAKAFNDMKWEAKSLHKSAPSEKDISMKVGYYWKDKRRRDIDSGLKATLDVLSGIVYVDDSQIKELHVTKSVDTVNPRVEIEIL